MDTNKYLRENHYALNEEQVERVISDIDKSSQPTALKDFFVNTEVGNVALAVTMVSMMFVSGLFPLYVRIAAICINTVSVTFWILHAVYRYIFDYEDKKLPQRDWERLQIVIFYSVLTILSVMFVDYMSNVDIIKNEFFLVALLGTGLLPAMSANFLTRDAALRRRLYALNHTSKKN